MALWRFTYFHNGAVRQATVDGYYLNSAHEEAKQRYEAWDWSIIKIERVPEPPPVKGGDSK